MELSHSESYRKAGVDVTRGYRAVELMKEHVARTRTPGVVSDIGGFGGLFEPDLKGIRRPVLVSGTDGVGTKLKLAFLLDRHDTVGQDCVAMCVNDVICAGARPLFFLDYIACGRNHPERIAAIVGGIADGCVEAGCALIGGETAEMPGFYPEDEYDLAGFVTALADGENMPDTGEMRPGDVLLGLPSSGVHSNGFSLVRHVLPMTAEGLGERLEETGKTLGETLLTPTRIYVRPVLNLLREVRVVSLAHITGGGLYENIPRAVADGLCAVVDRSNLPVHPVFRLIQQRGGIPERDMFNTFNMGLGMMLCVHGEDADRALEILRQSGENPFVLGHVERGGEKIRIE